MGRLRLDPAAGGFGEGRRASRQLCGQLPFGGSRRLGFGLELAGVPPGPQLTGVGLGQTHPLPGDGARGADPLTQTGQGVPDLLRRRDSWGTGPEEVLGLELGLAGSVQRGLDLRPPLPEQRFVGQLGFQRQRCLDEVVGQQPGPGIARLGLDDRRPAGDVGLAAQGLELAPDLRDQVGEPVEVALAGLQLAQCLLLALAVLEYTGGLLDESPPSLRGGLQDRVELALTHDDVHLPADPGVTEQVLNVQQPGGVAVDRVLRAPVAEHRAGDRHLGVVDRERTVSVVDREDDLGAAQRRPTGGAGEDDVFHLPAPQRLGPLLPHHPAQGVDHVGLARAVGPDHTGYARLEGERGGRGERLEPAQGQALEMH